MHLTLRQLQVFEAVARHLSYTRAAEELFLSQPAVSMQIRLLETQLGVTLLEQLGKRIHLTEAGREVYQYSRAITHQLEEMESVLANLKGLTGGKLRISVASTANYFVPNLLAAFYRRHPGVTVSLDITNRETLLHQLSENTVDLVIMGQPPAETDVESGAFMDNPLVVVAPPDHPLVKERHIQLTRLQNEVFLVREPGSGTRVAMERFFSERGIHITTGMEVGSNEAIKQSVQAGLGLGLLSRDTLEQELTLKRLAILDVAEFPILRHWYVVHRRGKRLPTVAQAFKEFLLKDARELLRGAAPSSDRRPRKGRGQLAKRRQ
jgi:LysR family transcriptional regulator, low CO2-responsive transcriptional regulator